MYVNVYYVWRRKDGYVGASCSGAGREKDWNNKDFTLLLVTEDWPEAEARIQAEYEEHGLAARAPWLLADAKTKA